VNEMNITEDKKNYFFCLFVSGRKRTEWNYTNW